MLFFENGEVGGTVGGGCIEAEVWAEAREALRSGKSALHHALHDGEDFELAFAVSPDDGRNLSESQPIPGMIIHRIGKCVESGIWLQNEQGRTPLEPSGWVHTW